MQIHRSIWLMISKDTPSYGFLNPRFCRLEKGTSDRLANEIWRDVVTKSFLNKRRQLIFSPFLSRRLFSNGKGGIGNQWVGDVSYQSAAYTKAKKDRTSKVKGLCVKNMWTINLKHMCHLWFSFRGPGRPTNTYLRVPAFSGYKIATYSRADIVNAPMKNNSSQFTFYPK